MRTSCNGCRVLRKGCSDSCTLRPCLQWIKSSEAQENATVFLAKFYGRSGLLNLINSGPEDLRPTIFRSLLYEACGRIENPILGSVGLLWSGKWQICQLAVDSILRGAYRCQPQNIYRVLSNRRIHNVNSSVRFKRPDSNRHATPSEGKEHLGHSNMRWRRSYNISKEFQLAHITELSGSCTQISSDRGAESEGIYDLTNRTLRIVSNENSCCSTVDAQNENRDASHPMPIQAETQNGSSHGRLFEKNSCSRLEIKQKITDDKSVELELRLGSLDCYSCNPTLSQPAVCNSYWPSNNGCMDASLSPRI